MAADEQPIATTWNIFFHFNLDKNSLSALAKQCIRLVEFSTSIDHWNTSPYGLFLKVSTEYTLAELRRHWSLYSAMGDLPAERLKIIRDAFTPKLKASWQQHREGAQASSACSYGAVMKKASPISSEQFDNYWKTGITSTDPQQIAAATLINPTFFYSLAGEGFVVQGLTDPLVPFHLAALQGNARAAVSVADIVKAAQLEFTGWCSAFHSSVSSTSDPVPVIRFFLGEATAVCRALRAFTVTEKLDSGIPVAPWKAQTIKLDKAEYASASACAPTAFNIIDTSNMDDHIGLLNILIAVVLLSSSNGSSVLYTESLVSLEIDATKDFTERLYGNITTVGLLINLCPIDYLSGFTTRCNIHELTMYRNATKKLGGASQFHQVTTWKAPTSGDPIVGDRWSVHGPPVFDSRQLGTLLYDIYQQLFVREDPTQARRALTRSPETAAKDIATSNLVHYTRESYAKGVPG